MTVKNITVNSISSANKWFVSTRTNENAELRLFLFPYAGGGPPAFAAWDEEFDSRIETVIVHYPGRGSRFREQPIKRIDILVENLFQAIQPYLDKPFAFFGHSLGSLIAFELAKLVQPQVLFVSGCIAPHLPNPRSMIHHLPNPDFIKSLKEFNGIPNEVASNSELMELLIPMLRADFEAFETYRTNSHQLPCPIVGFGGLDDPSTSREQLDGWSAHTSANFRSQYFSGDHFFINANKKDIIAAITSEIT